MMNYETCLCLIVVFLHSNMCVTNHENSQRNRLQGMGDKFKITPKIDGPIKFVEDITPNEFVIVNEAPELSEQSHQILPPLHFDMDSSVIDDVADGESTAFQDEEVLFPNPNTDDVQPPEFDGGPFNRIALKPFGYSMLNLEHLSNPMISARSAGPLPENRKELFHPELVGFHLVSMPTPRGNEQIAKNVLPANFPNFDLPRSQVSSSIVPFSNTQTSNSQNTVFLTPNVQNIQTQNVPISNYQSIQAPNTQVVNIRSPNIQNPNVQTQGAPIKAVQSPSVQAHNMQLPNVHPPHIQTPNSQTASAPTPKVYAPSISAPSIPAPSVLAHNFQTPSVQTPSVQTPSVQTPSVQTPSVQASSVQALSTHSSSVQAQSVQAQSIQATSVQAQSVQASSVQAPISTFSIRPVQASVTSAETKRPLYTAIGQPVMKSQRISKGGVTHRVYSLPKNVTLEMESLPSQVSGLQMSKLIKLHLKNLHMEDVANKNLHIGLTGNVEDPIADFEVKKIDLTRRHHANQIKIFHRKINKRDVALGIKDQPDAYIDYVRKILTITTRSSHESGCSNPTIRAAILYQCNRFTFSEKVRLCFMHEKSVPGKLSRMLDQCHSRLCEAMTDGQLVVGNLLCDIAHLFFDLCKNQTKMEMEDDVCDFCKDGYYGFNCEMECGYCPDDHSCDVITGVCPSRKRCPEGRIGSTCKERTECPSQFPYQVGRLCYGVVGHDSFSAAIKICKDKESGKDLPSSHAELIDVATITKIDRFFVNKGNASATAGYEWKNGKFKIVDDNLKLFIVCAVPLLGRFAHNLPCGICPYNYTCNGCGRCPRNGRCSSGYGGPDCTRACKNGTFGQDCTKQCGTCPDGSTCNRTTGMCKNANKCSSGFFGYDCSKRCHSGYFGYNCELSCGQCEGRKSCMPSTGKCKNDQCPRRYKWNGKLCFPVGTVPCPLGRFHPPECSLVCGLCPKTKFCDPLTGLCRENNMCSAGYTGSSCTAECSSGNFGQNCSLVCGNCPDGNTCDRHGFCSDLRCSDGFTFSEAIGCATRCVSGWYGPGCLGRCGYCPGGSSCNSNNGSCPGGNCPAGFTGQGCQRGCSLGKFGYNCLRICGKCPDEWTCNGVTGLCQNNLCSSGWKGSMCGTRCQRGKFGQNCKLRCGGCLKGVCNPVTGQCPGLKGEMCSSGFHGNMCSHRCPSGNFGQNCFLRCGRCPGFQECDPVTGRCTNNICSSGYAGPYCQIKCKVGKFGQNCKLSCGPCIMGDTCDPLTGRCKSGRCSSGFTGESCAISCFGIRRYGEDCHQECGHCYNQSDCEHVSGKCPDGTCSSGHVGVFCEEACVMGLFGPNCERICGACPEKIYCGRNNGECLAGGCSAGWHGLGCLKPCPGDRYGRGCSEKCRCVEGKECDRLSGMCSDKRCSRGRMGEGCIKICPPGIFGPNCTSTCGHCGGNSSQLCHPVTGLCPSGECSSGHTGKYCLIFCPVGYFGKNCSFKCGFCNEGVCDAFTGKCSDGRCSAGFEGKECSTVCPNGKYGQDCERTCGSCPDNLICHHETGLCSNALCSSGNSGEMCTSDCESSTFGQNCTYTCGACPDGSTCDARTGYCTHDKICSYGYHGKLCDEMCIGNFGPNCERECGVCPNRTICSASDGKCSVNGRCSSGWTGQHCLQSCLTGYFGQECENKCNYCPGNAVCSAMTGKCPNNHCSTGYWGLECDTPCPSGLFGPNCGFACGYCDQSRNCDITTGRCPNDLCSTGYVGPQCQDGCERGWFGTKCAYKCGKCQEGDCDPMTGLCDGKVCSKGYTGALCDEVVSIAVNPDEKISLLLDKPNELRKKRHSVLKRSYPSHVTARNNYNDEHLWQEVDQRYGKDSLDHRNSGNAQFNASKETKIQSLNSWGNSHSSNVTNHQKDAMMDKFESQNLIILNSRNILWSKENVEGKGESATGKSSHRGLLDDENEMGVIKRSSDLLKASKRTLSDDKKAGTQIVYDIIETYHPLQDINIRNELLGNQILNEDYVKTNIGSTHEASNAMVMKNDNSTMNQENSVVPIDKVYSTSKTENYYGLPLSEIKSKHDTTESKKNLKVIRESEGSEGNDMSVNSKSFVEGWKDVEYKLQNRVINDDKEDNKKNIIRVQNVEPLLEDENAFIDKFKNQIFENGLDDEIPDRNDYDASNFTNEDTVSEGTTMSHADSINSTTVHEVSPNISTTTQFSSTLKVSSKESSITVDDDFSTTAVHSTSTIATTIADDSNKMKTFFQVIQSKVFQPTPTPIVEEMTSAEPICEKGWYGPGCAYRCGFCGENRDCDAITGRCFIGRCSSGYWGHNCRKNCLSGYYGMDCEEKCYSCVDDLPCNRTTGECQREPCPSGFWSLKCDIPCTPGSFGPDCIYSCGLCPQGEPCIATSGRCSNGVCSSGYTGKDCSTPCRDKYWGHDCKTRCSNTCNGRVYYCDRITGRCVHDNVCPSGYFGSNCRTPCPIGTYGPQCRFLCGECYDKGFACHHVTGLCKNLRCSAGYFGRNCRKSCPFGKYGKGCAFNCPQCDYEETCEPRTGMCHSKPNKNFFKLTGKITMSTASTKLGFASPFVLLLILSFI